MEKLKLGFALTGSYCTFEKALNTAARLCARYDVTPIMSENAASTDSRFGRAADFIAQLEEMTGKPVIRTIAGAEPIGPKKLLQALIIAPCTGNTLAKLAHGITDSCVTMAAKAHLRNGRPLVIAISTNDGLSANAGNLGTLLTRRHTYLVPFGQDDSAGKPSSLVADFERIEETIDAAMECRQLQPLLL